MFVNERLELPNGDMEDDVFQGFLKKDYDKGLPKVLFRKVAFLKETIQLKEKRISRETSHF